VIAQGFTSGGFFPDYWGWEILAAAVCVLVLTMCPRQARLSRSERLVLGALTFLTLLTWSSARWALAGADTTLAGERALLYLVCLAAFLLCTPSGEEGSLLEGVLAAISVVCVYALYERITAGAVSVPFEGGLLTGTVGYANALGALAAMGWLLSSGLAAFATPRRARVLRALAVVLAVVVALTESRGAVFAAVLGLGVMLFAAKGDDRRAMVRTLMVVLPFSLVGAALAFRSAGWLLALEAIGFATAAAAARPLVSRRSRRIIVSAIAISVAALALLASHGSGGLSGRRTYWSVALRDAGRHPVIGSGAGSYRSVWVASNPEGPVVANAHSLYLETLAELGVVGLLALGVVVFVPLAAVMDTRDRSGVPVAAGAYVLFLVHAGIDWDWQMPVVVTAGLGCAGALLVAHRTNAGVDSQRG
jgi:O-antigen ligase